MSGAQSNLSKTSNTRTTSDFSNIRLLNLSDVHKAAKTLLASFKTDALARLLVAHIETQAEKDRCETLLYEAYLRQHILKGLCFGINETDRGFETVAIWSTPTSVHDGLDSFGVLMESGYNKVWDLFGEIGREKVFYGMLPLLHDSCERILTNDSRFRNKGVWTLVYLGSTVEARGKGNVRKMFDYMYTKYIDASDNNIAYLESSSPSNIPIYERFGFRFYEDIVLGDSTSKDAIEGEDFAVMNVMIRGPKGRDWTKDKNVIAEKGKL